VAAFGGEQHHRLLIKRFRIEEQAIHVEDDSGWFEDARQKRLEQQPETGPTPWFGSSRRWRPFGAYMRRRHGEMGLMCLGTPNTRSGVSRDQGRVFDTALRASRRVDGIRALNLRDDAAAQRQARRLPYSESARPDRDIAQPLAEPHPRCVRCYRCGRPLPSPQLATVQHRASEPVPARWNR
jgi:hypothetical protein